MENLWGPPARYLIVLLPSMLLVVAYAVEVLLKKWWGKLTLITIGIYSTLLSLSLYYVGKHGYGLYLGKSFQFNWVLEKIRFPINSDLLTMNFYEPYVSNSDYVKGSIAMLLVLSVSYLIARKENQSPNPITTSRKS